MASIEDQIKSARTMEDIVNLLTILFTNLNNQNEMYYDMFLNPIPMDLKLQRYDEKGDLVTVTLPNVAKMRITSYSGEGNPNGKQPAAVGALYIDTNTRTVYYKATGSDSYGWQLIWSTANLVEGVDFLSPTGDGSQVHDLNASNVSSGTLKVTRGGTGTGLLSGILKGNGENPVSTAIVDEDYLAPSSFTGLIMYCPTAVIPDGWLICDGTIYNISVQPELTRLFNKLGNKYGGNGTTTFGVPDLIDRYIKCGVPADVGNAEDGVVGKHTHSVSGSTNNDGSHSHKRGTMDITGSIPASENLYSKNYTPEKYGCFYKIDSNVVSGYSVNNRFDNDYWGFKASNSWTGETSYTPHKHSFTAITGENGTAEKNEVDHMVMVPIIKY